jgi:hypothetical protein
MKILYTSLFPRFPYKQHEQENLEFFMNSIKYYNYNNIFDFCIGSAHKDSLKTIDSFFGSTIIKYISEFHFYTGELVSCDFKYTPNMSEERGHEISFSKQKLFKSANEIVKEKNTDYLFYIDADMQIDSKDVIELCNSLKDKPNTFVNIPYPLRDLKCITNTSFGCYIIPYSILKENQDLYEVIYKTREADGIIHRVGAPDCNIREELLRRGYKELHAHSIRIKHYINESNYLEYDNGVIKEF